MTKHSVKCKHRHAATVPGTDRCYYRGVACHPYTDENRAAHGGIECMERCPDCGAERSVISNGCHREYGIWAAAAKAEGGAA